MEKRFSKFCNEREREREDTVVGMKMLHTVILTM